jgi:hypothetical protein
MQWKWLAFHMSELYPEINVFLSGLALTLVLKTIADVIIDLSLLAHCINNALR